MITEESLNVLGSAPFVVGDESRENFGEMHDNLDEAIMALKLILSERRATFITAMSADVRR